MSISAMANVEGCDKEAMCSGKDIFFTVENDQAHVEKNNHIGL